MTSHTDHHHQANEGKIMNSKERILAAINLQQPDMVPVFELEISASLLQPISEILFGEKAFKSNKNRLHEMTAPEQKDYLQSFCKIIGALGLDGITEGPANPAQQVDAEHIKDVYGNIRVLNPHGMALVVRGAVESPAELKSYKLPPPKEQDYDHMELIRSQLPDIAMTLRVEDTFKAAWELRGSMQNYLMDYFEQPDFIKEISTMMTDYACRQIELAAKRGVDIVFVGGDLASNYGPLISPEHYEEFVFPHHKQMCEVIHSFGLKALKHTDGAVMPIMDKILEAGFDVYHPTEPSLLDIGDMKKAYGDRICLMGNVDCTYILEEGTAAEVETDVLRVINKASPGGGHILSSSNSIHPNVKPENFITMLKAARKYGNYSHLGRE